MGVPLCWISGCFRLFSRTTQHTLIKRILVIKFFGMGSIILSSPALSLLRTRYPQAQIDFLSFDSNKELLERYPLIDHVMIIRTSTLYLFVRDTLNIIFHIRRSNYDVVFDFEFFSKFSTLLSSLSCAKHRIGFAIPTLWRKLHLTQQVFLTKTKHVSIAFCEQVFCLTGVQPVPAIMPPQIFQYDVELMKDKLPLNGKQVIAINVNTSTTFVERRWQSERFVDLINKLSMETEAYFFFVGIDKDWQYVQNIIDATANHRRCYNIAGLLSVPELAALLQQCEMLISNDSGPVHLAASLGTPVIALYGPESPHFYGPIGSTASVIYKKTHCSPCMNIFTAKSFSCPYNANCMNEIQVDDVMQSIKNISVQA